MNIGNVICISFMAIFQQLDDCTDKPFLYLRYVDDIFVIFQHGEVSLNNFINM